MPTPIHRQLRADADAGLARVLAVTDEHPGVSLGAAYLGRTTTDVLSHLHGWHGLFAGWLEQHAAGGEVAYPAEGYTWDNIDALNDIIFRTHQGRPYLTMRTALEESHQRVMALLVEISSDDLTSPQAFPWTGGVPLVEVAHECLGGHYEWATKVLSATELPTVA